MKNEFDHIKANIKNTRSLARCISLVENKVAGYEDFMCALETNGQVHITGITGPPGAGKSTITDALIEAWISENNKIAVLCVDPSSPFNYGAILGDRIRMSTWYNHPNVFIRSMASRGSLGGLAPMILEVTELLKAAGFDKIIIETVGVGQSEVEVAGIADTTMVVLVPEAGDDVQNMKAGLMEIADVFVVNKADRPGADTFINNLKYNLVVSEKEHDLPVFQTIASSKTGIANLVDYLNKQEICSNKKLKREKICEMVYQIIQNRKMEHITRDKIMLFLESNEEKNIFQIATNYLKMNA